MKRAIVAQAAAEIVIAYLSNGGKVRPAQMKKLVGGVCRALSAPPTPMPIAPAAAPLPARWKPAVRISKSVRPDALICLVCGSERLSLRRHLGSAHNLSPDRYRELFNLSDDYPMDAAAYTRVRSELAKARGLGKSIVWTERPSAQPRRRRPSPPKRQASKSR